MELSKKSIQQRHWQQATTFYCQMSGCDGFDAFQVVFPFSADCDCSSVYSLRMSHWKFLEILLASVSLMILMTIVRFELFK